MKKFFHVSICFIFFVFSFFHKGLSLDVQDIERCKPPLALEKQLDVFFTQYKQQLYMPEVEQLRKEYLAAVDIQDVQAGCLVIEKTEHLLRPKFEQLAELLRKNGCNVLKNDEKTIVFLSADFPQYICKVPGYIFSVIYGNSQHNILRIDGARLIDAAIQKYGLTGQMRVPAKYLYHLPGKKTELNDDNYIVVAEQVILSPDEVDTLSPSKDLFRIILATGYDDIHSKNIVTDINKKIVFLDTEDFISYDKDSMDSYIKGFSEEHSFVLRELLYTCALLKSNEQKNKDRACSLYKKLYFFNQFERFFSSSELLEELRKEIKECLPDIEAFDAEILKVKDDLQLDVPVQRFDEFRPEKLHI